MQDIQLEDILEKGVLYSFYGVDGTMFKLGNLVFEAVEDPDDGYRSYLQSILLIENLGIFPDKPIINLYYTTTTDSHGDEYTEFVDKNGHCWLRIGTNYQEDYYPYFVFDYDPDRTVTKYSEPIHNLPKFDPKNIHPEKLI